MSYKYKFSLIVISFFLVIALCISSSYAIWIFSVSQETTNVVVTDCFELRFSNERNNISLEYAFPMEDGLGVQTRPFEFTVTNICNHAADLQINLETLNGSTLDLSNIKTDLNGKILAVEDAEEVEPTLDNASSALKLEEYTLEANASKDYNLRLWVKEDAIQGDIENTIFNSKVTIKATVRKKYDVAILKNGEDFNVILKRLAGDNNPYYYTYNRTVTSIQRSLIAPTESDNAVVVSDSGSASDIYAWFKDGTIYIYSDVDKIYMNENSSSLFYGFSKITSLDLSYFDTSKVTTMSKMFRNMDNLETLDLSSFDTSKVTSMVEMFDHCNSLHSLNINNFDTSNVTNMDQMFTHCINLESLDVSHFNTSKVTGMSEMFSSTQKLTELDVSHFDTSNVKNMYYMFCGSNELTRLDLRNFNTSNVTNMEGMFFGLKKITNLDVSGFDTSNVTNMSEMFRSMSNLTSIDVSNFDTSKVRNMSNMFLNMSNLTSLDVSNFNTSNVTNMSSMFSSMSNLTSLDVSNFNTSSVSNMKEMFMGMKQLEILDLSNFDTSSVTNMSSMFSGMNNLKILDISHFNTSNVTNMSNMFYNMSNVVTIYVGNIWNTSSVTNSIDMFYYCSKIVGGAGTIYDKNHIDKEYARVDDPTNGNPGYLTLKTN